ncbi:MAG TPA: alpha/beta hydrolase [Candidatus Binatia bacterium]|jgi:pimeloyl-ACP methyl ester carboxylesterase|nr:alpha/beta hydrolase [Candidatus Binatia bacterium]
MTTIEKVELRVHGSPALPTLIYLPGLHGDWTLVASFRRALAGRMRFVEATYPRTLSWSLDDYAAGVEKALAAAGITAGWLLGESFSSQVVWSMAARKRFQIESIILAGGFARHPTPLAARFAQHLTGGVSMRLLKPLLAGYASVARFRYRHSPEVRKSMEEFIARRTLEDKQAAQHRLGLVAQNDPRRIAQQTSLPVYALTGALDPIVPWIWVRRWLKKNCPALRAFKIIWRADHNVLATAPEASAEQVVKWITHDQCPPQCPGIGPVPIAIPQSLLSPNPSETLALRFRCTPIELFLCLVQALHQGSRLGQN